MFITSPAELQESVIFVVRLVDHRLHYGKLGKLAMEHLFYTPPTFGRKYKNPRLQDM